MICVAPDCDRLDATSEYGVPPVEAAAEILCLAHFRDLVKRRATANETRALAQRRADILAMPKMTCYGNGGTCTNIGVLYPGGPFCAEHAPDPFKPDAEGTSSNAFAKRSVFVLTGREKIAGNTFDDEADDAGNWEQIDLDQQDDDEAKEPMLKAVQCPEDRIPGSVKAAIKRAVAHGWDYRVNLAIGPEPKVIHSVVFTASKDDVEVSSRHEGADLQTLRFKVGWHRRNNDLPIAIGWRELTAALEGQDPNDADKRVMRQAALDVMDVGGQVIEIRPTG